LKYDTLQAGVICTIWECFRLITSASVTYHPHISPSQAPVNLLPHKLTASRLQRHTPDEAILRKIFSRVIHFRNVLTSNSWPYREHLPTLVTSTRQGTAQLLSLLYEPSYSCPNSRGRNLRTITSHVTLLGLDLPHRSSLMLGNQSARPPHYP
jgi:hypothetical protein